MSYVVFARKWRPLTVGDHIGQEHITGTLKRAIEKNRVAHAYLFTGTRGVGKTTTARILARALNCDKGPTPDPCGVCESCKNIMNGSSFDVLEIDGASNNGVEHIRELRENVTYTSMGGKYRIFVIDEVHMLTKGAFNALLKTLEEPPKNVIFIFATTEPQKIPETIHSRCQRFDFRRISTEQIVAQLGKICSNEKIGCDTSGLELIGRRADGSMRDALSLLDQVYSFCQENISEHDVRSVLGLVETETYNNILAAVMQKSPQNMLRIVEEVQNRGFDTLDFLTGFLEYLRTLLLSRLPGIADNRRLDLSTDTIRQQTDLAAAFSETDILRMSEIIRRAESDLRWSSFPRFLIEITLLKLVYMDSSVSVEQILSSLRPGAPAADASSPKTADYPGADKKKTGPPEPVENRVAEKIQPLYDAAVTSIRPQEDPGSFVLAPQTGGQADLAALWPAFLDRLTTEHPNLGTFLSPAAIAAGTGSSLDLRFKKQFGFQFAEVTRANNRDTIIKKLSSFAGKPVDLHIVLEKNDADTGDTPKQAALEPFSTKKKTHASLEQETSNEPVITSVLDIFDGEVV